MKCQKEGCKKEAEYNVMDSLFFEIGRIGTFKSFCSYHVCQKAPEICEAMTLKLIKISNYLLIKDLELNDPRPNN